MKTTFRLHKLKVENACPVCHYVFDMATNVNNGNAPEPNAVTVCILCSAMLQFDDKLQLHKLSPGQLVGMRDAYPERFKELMEVSRTVLALKKQHGDKWSAKDKWGAK